jgi:cob(I)alamin adenosyltransferase
MKTNNTRLQKDASRVYTRSGDKGKTSLLLGDRVPKHDLRITANGTIDELNSWIGYIRAIDRDRIVEDKLSGLQPKLNILCFDIAAPVEMKGTSNKFRRVNPIWEKELESEIDLMEKELIVLKHPILPGGSPIGAALHLSRTVCRRAEVMLVHLQNKKKNVNPEAMRFVNRLSDYLFTLARWVNHRAGLDDA